MKNNSLAFVCALILVGGIAAFIIQSCTKSGEKPSTDAMNKIASQSMDEQLPTWQSKLDYIMTGAGAPLFNNQGLKLLSYSVSNNVDAESLKASKVSEDVLVPAYTRTSADMNKFALVHMSETMSAVHSEYAGRKQAIINSRGGEHLIPVTLNWSYNGNQFTTTGLVSLIKQTVVYDDILSNILTFRIVKPASITKSSSVATIKTLDETIPNGPVSYSFGSDEYEWTSWYGSLVANAYVTVTVYGTSTSNVINMQNFTVNATQWALTGYSANAQVVNKSFVPGTGATAHLDVVWGAMVGGAPGLTLMYNGSGFTIPPGCNGGSGETYIIPSQLHP